jgi:hypothetical protein
VPGFGSNEGIGEGAVATLEGLAAIDDGARVTSAAVRFAPGSNGIVRYREFFNMAVPERAYVPAAIGSIARVRSIPFVLAGVLGGLAVLSVAHGIVTSLRARRHDLAILRSLGADRRFTSRVVHWQASAFSLVPLVIGAPLGFILGRIIFAAYARNMGAIDGATLPAIALAVVALSVLLLANLAASLPGRGLRPLSPADLLQQE